jgi:cell division protein FtsB
LLLNDKVQTICITIGTCVFVLALFISATIGCQITYSVDQTKAQLEIEKTKLDQQKAENDRIKLEKFGVK